MNKKHAKQNMSSSLLFEIGTEEIPSGYFEGAEASILAKAPKLLAECGWQFDSLNVRASPRHLVVAACGFKPMEVSEEEKVGPAKDKAYQDGKPNDVLRGFLKSTGRRESDVYFKETQRGVCVCVKLKKQFKPLQYFFETLPKQIDFPKVMKWEKSRYSFTRPIRWTFALVGNRVQKFTVADVVSGNFTMGHRFLSPRPIAVSNSDPCAYEKLLARHHVILNAQERITKIHAILKNAHGQNGELVQAVAYLVEEPFGVSGRFPKEYLTLPAAVLETCMSKQLKVFACHDRSGKLKNEFIAVINGKRKNVKRIAANYERVLCSRLKDAQFFFQEDTKTKLVTKVEKLKEMVFLGSLGSYWDKTERLKQMVVDLGAKANCPKEVIERAMRAAELSKADLTTRLVYEFPELQGIAGSEYARFDGEDPNVSGAISGHYLPKNLSEDFRELKRNLNLEGAILGLCDRMDLIVGAFKLGIEPSGSQDPYALRRAAGGIVKLLRAYPLPISLCEWIEKTWDLYERSDKEGQRAKKEISKDDVIKKIASFLKERIIFETQVRPGTKEYELLAAVLAGRFDQVADVFDRFEQLAKIMDQDEFISASKVMERTANILKGAKDEVGNEVDSSIFQDPLEHQLLGIVLRLEMEVGKLIESKQYVKTVQEYGAGFYQIIHDFFDRVKVNADDAAVRKNRQALMKKVFKICADKVADLSLMSNLS